VSIIASYSAGVRLPVDQNEAGSSLEGTPAWLALKDAVEATAEELGGRVEAEITDYYHQTTPCDFAVVTPAFTRGVGLRANRSTGEVSFLYDDYGGFRHTASEIVSRITQNFAAVAIARALMSLHYDVEFEETRTEKGKKEVVVRGALK
jgi:hypothetical protein